MIERGPGGRCATALVTTFALLSQALVAPPLFAQDEDAPASLEDLIPDAALDDPEAWAAGGADIDVPAPEETPFELDAASPMEDMPLVTIESPENLALEEVEPIDADEEIEFVTFDDVITPIPVGSEEVVSSELVLVFPSELTLFPQRDEFLDRFKMLSQIENLDSGDNNAQLNAQARADEELLQRMLRVYGYFDAQVIRSVGDIDPTVAADVGRPAVRFDILPGARYTVGAVDLGDLRQAGADYDLLRGAYEVFPGEDLSLDAIEQEQFDLDTLLGETGYPFAEIADPSLLVDHARQEGDVTLPVKPNGKYVFGQIVSSDPDFLSGKHLQDIARFDPGDIYQRSEQMDLRRAILATGLVGSITMTPVEVAAPTADAPGTVDMEVNMTQAPLRTLAGNIGFGTEEGIRIAGSWEHRNLFPPEGMLRVRGIIGTQEQLAGVTFRKNNFKGRDRILTIDAFASTLDYDLYDARTLSLIANYERVSNLLFQKPFSYGIGLELVATEQSEIKVKGEKSEFQRYLIAALPGFIQVDTSDDLLDPTEGFRVRTYLSPEISRLDATNSTYLKAQVDASTYRRVSERIVVAGRGRIGTIVGAETFEIAPSRRFYAGGGGSVRGYGYQTISPRNGVGEPNGGRSLLEVSAEARIQTKFFDGAISVVPFVDAGSVTRSSMPGLDDIRVGAGVGVRYATGFGPLRLDVAVPLNPGPNDSFVAVYVALGQAF